VLRSERVTLPVPLVIRLVYYVRVPHRLGPPLTRRTVLARDRYTCQYCGSPWPATGGAQPGKRHLTVDHVLPRCRGGQTTWDNVVAACEPCNRRKGDRTPEEAGMRLLSRPARPRYVAIVLMSQAEAVDIWQKYLG